MSVDRDKVIKAMTAYIYFIVDNEPKDENDVKRFDSKRKELHNELARTLGFNPEDHYSRWHHFDDTANRLNDWKKWFDSLEDFIVYHSDRLIDKVSENTWDGIKTNYALKGLIDKYLSRIKEQIVDRMKPIDKIMDEAKKNYDAWFENEVMTGKAKHSYHLNTHDYNKWTGVIHKCVKLIESLASLPREAYLKVVTQKYYEEPYEQIKTALANLEVIAFQTEHTVYPKEPYYEYLEKDKED